MRYLCKTNDGEYYLSSQELADALDRETIRGPVNVTYAMPVLTGTGSVSDGSKYSYAQADGWRVVHWPYGGGSEAYIKVDGIGWCVDANEEMPHSVWISLLTAVGAPIDRDSDPQPNQMAY